MARIRTVKPEYWTDSLMVSLPPLTRLIYIALWNCADDHGYIRDEPERIAMEVMPREDPAAVDAAIQTLAACGRLELFIRDDGSSFYQIAKWAEHQRVDHPAQSKIFREGSRKLAIPTAVRRGVAEKYGCQPGEKADAQCFYCGAPGSVLWTRLYDGRPSGWVVFPGLELDHLEAENEGGENSCGNIVLSCRSCNRSKGTARWEEFLKAATSRESSRVLAKNSDDSRLKWKGKEQGTGETPTPAALRLPDAGASKPPAPEKPTDPVKDEIWQTGKAILIESEGMSKDRAGSLLGKLVKDYGQRLVLDAVRDCAKTTPAKPSEWLVARCQERRPAGGEALEARNRAAGAAWLAKMQGGVE